MARMRMRFGIRGPEIVFEAVAPWAAEEMVVVGIAEYGTCLFAVRQRGLELHIDAASRELRGLAVRVMDALHRAYWITPPPSSQPGDPVLWKRGEERVSEWRQADLSGRDFASDDTAPPVAEVAIHYSSSARYGHGARVEVRNASCGYEAVIVILEHERDGTTARLGTETPLR